MYTQERVSEASIDMARFDTTSIARLANEQLAGIREPRRRQILINFRDHALAEAVGDYEALMATCSKKRQRYEVYADVDNEFTRHQPRSYAELESHYKALIDSNMYLIHGDTDKLIVGDDEIFIELVQHMVVPGMVARFAFGVEDAEDAAVYLFTTRLGIVFIFDEDGMGCGEHAFGGSVSLDNMRRLSDEEIPAQFFSGPRTVAGFFAANPDLEWPQE